MRRVKVAKTRRTSRDEDRLVIKDLAEILQAVRRLSSKLATIEKRIVSIEREIKAIRTYDNSDIVRFELPETGGRPHQTKRREDRAGVSLG